MNKLLVAFLLLFVLGTTLMDIYTQQNKMSGTYTTSYVGITDDTINVASTGGFSSTGLLELDNEYMTYSNLTTTQFRGVLRGQKGSVATAHLGNTGVYTEKSGSLNSGLRFYDLRVSESGGVLSIIMFPIKFFTSTIWSAVVFDYRCFSDDMGDTPIGFVSYIAAAVTIPFLFTMCYLVLVAIGGILQKFLNLPG